MRDWYMDNDDRTLVNPDADIAYDTDNDAWAPLGSSEGSTPYWWRFYDKGDGTSNNDRQLTQEELAERKLREREAEEWSNYVQRVEKEIDSKRAHADELDSKHQGGKYFAIAVGIVDLVFIVLACFVNIGLLASFAFWFDLLIFGTFIGGIIHLIVRAVFETNASSERKKADAMEKELENKKKQHRANLFRRQ